jgi:hypothetical protein
MASYMYHHPPLVVLEEDPEGGCHISIFELCSQPPDCHSVSFALF